MSNPGVILLAQALSTGGTVKRFQIEDNIGESIHVHIDNIRIDLTVSEFMLFANLIGASLDKLLPLGGGGTNKFDPMFLLNCAPYLSNLMQISIKTVSLKDLKFIVYRQIKGVPYFHKICGVKDTPAYRYLEYQDPLFLDYSQDGYFQQDNATRIAELKQSIEENGYPYNERYIILFNNQYYVRDGQHRAAVLAHLHGVEEKIEVMMFRFKGNIGDYRYARTSAIVVARVMKWVVRNLYYKLKAR